MGVKVENQHWLTGTCEGCARRIDGLGRIGPDGSLYHISCGDEFRFTELGEPEPPGPVLKKFRVKVKIVEYDYYDVVAKDMDEAEELVGEKICSDSEIDWTDEEKGEVTASDLRQYEQDRAALDAANKRRGEIAAAHAARRREMGNKKGA